jgi:2-oxoglutarate/2-oxoacid ferredoxin oxidoreductase subunit alpha
MAPTTPLRARPRPARAPDDAGRDGQVDLGEGSGGRVLMKGNEAMAEAAIRAGCDAESELTAINIALGASAAGARVMVSSSSPGMSLMAEAMSYMAGSELPVLLVNVMRGGPGLGNIAPAQSDYFQATKGHGHGDYRVPVLAPASIDEAIALVLDGFTLAEQYRTPVILLADGILGQAMEPVQADFGTLPPRHDDWSLGGARDRPPRVVKSLHLGAEDLAAHNRDLQEKLARIARDEVRWSGIHLADAELLVVAYGTAARIARTAVERARAGGLRVGLLRPISLWPFPTTVLRRLAPAVRAILVVELSAGQLVEDVRLAVEGAAPVFLLGRPGGVLPSPGDVVHALTNAWAMTEDRPAAARDSAEDDEEADPVGLIVAAEWSRATGRGGETRR